ncbi:SCO family protein [Zestomonas carbonaria]|uniref:Protein SCO1/2 n=1 Tax=Zestomonas carbonaria TaxID=2762745 RepID=A0A7U7EQ08_9GAMM|nr:SCO family protein [Pseudomonas carbonaria]CAD5108976.1 hypothetical protein PSEWESI4_03272 [Pseudomonas carbonaria]
MRKLHSSLAVALFGAITLCGTAQAHSPEEHARHPQSMQPREESAQVRFADVPLIDQNGHEVRLKDDLVADRIVVMGFVYTSCSTVCPVISSIMAKVQKQVGDNAQLISISVDPLRDTPQVLREYSRKFQSGPGWTWLTGSPQAISDTLKELGSWTPRIEDHPPQIMVGDARTGRWTRYYGFTNPTVLVERVEQLAAARKHHGHSDVHQLSSARGVAP